MRKYVYAFIMCTGFWLDCSAQESVSEALPRQFFFRTISTNEGLSHIIVNAILRDSRGFLWIGTEDGLNRYDGSNFKIFRNDPRDSSSVCHNLIYSLLEEKSSGNIWIGTINGLCYYDRHSEKITVIKSSNDVNRSPFIKIIFDEKRNRLWMACEEAGLRYLDLGTKKLQNFKHPGIDGEYVLSVELAGDRLFVGTTAHGLKAIDLGSNTVTEIGAAEGQKEGSPNQLVKVTLSTPGYLWIGTDGGLNRLRLSDQSLTSFTKEKGNIASNRIRAIAQDRAGNIWVGTDGGGLTIFDKDGNHPLRYLHSEFDERSLSDNTVRTIYIEPQGDAWLGTYGGGISYHSLNSNDFYLFKKEFGSAHSLSDDNVNTFAVTPDHRIWMGTEDGLNYLVNGVVSRFPLDRYFGGDPQVVTSLCADHGGGLWIGTYQHGALYLNKDGTIRQFLDDSGKVGGLNSSMIWHITEDQRGYIWLGTESGVNIFDPVKKIFHNLKNKPDNEFGKIFRDIEVQTILISNNRKIWIGTYGYLQVYDSATDKTTMFSALRDSGRIINNPPVAVLQEDSDGELLIGTYGNGLCKYDNASGRFTIIDETDGLPNNNVMSVQKDDKGNLWLGTNRGIVKYDPVSKSVISYDEQYGLQGQVFNPRASLRLPGGFFLFGGVKGANLFGAREVMRDSADLEVAFTDFQLNNKSIVPGDKILENSISETESISLDYDRSRLISFQFSCLNFFSEKIQYEYEFEGFATGTWQLLTKAMPLTFTNLDPGTYQLRIRAFINPQIKGPVKVMNLFIAAPWYKTWYARVGFVILALGSAIAFMTFRTHRLQVRKADLERRVAEQNQQILIQNDKLRSQNEMLLNKNEEIQSQTEELLAANQVLTELHREVSEQKEEIQTQSEELTESYVAISEINQTLEQKIESRTSELQRAFQELDTFFYRSSHDFRRPLTTFMGLAQVARITVKDSTAIDLFEKVEETARNLDRMVKKLQSVGDVGSDEIVKSNVSIQQLVDQALMSFGNELVKKNIHVKLQIDFQREIHTFPLLLKIIIENLIENAIQFHGPVDPFIALRVFEKDSGVMVEVSDNGRGIDVQYHQRIFEMYFRASEMSKGNGLGLFIVRKAADRLDGKITFESEKNSGSRFTFWFKPDPYRPE